MKKQVLIKTTIISLIVVAVLCGCIYYIYPSLQSLKGICDLLLTWFSVSLVIDFVKFIVIYVSSIVTKKEGGSDEQP